MNEMTELSQEIQRYNINNEKLKFENEKLIERIDEISKLITDKENEFTLMLNNKNIEKDNLMKILYEVNDEMILLENKFNHVNSDLNENNIYLSNELNLKNERLIQIDEENKQMKELIDELQYNHNNGDNQLKEKEELFDELKNQHIVRF